MLVSVIAMLLGLVSVTGILYQNFGDQIYTELEREAAYLASGVELEGVAYLENLNDEDRITYIDGDGTVLYDNQADQSSMENHNQREEVREAAVTGSGSAVRMSSTLSEMTIYYALRLEDGTILRVSSTRASVLALVLQMLPALLLIFAVMILFSSAFAIRLSRNVVRPINELDLEHPEDSHIYEEVEPLLSRLYRQNRQIQGQIEAARRQQEEFSLITENMQEGLLVIDRYTMILSGNSGVARLFRVKQVKVGESVYALNRSEDFRRLIENVLEGRHQDTVLQLDGSHVQVIGDPAMDGGSLEGAVILLMDVTEKVERERFRREFSANVSHELKTPLTSISGFAEIMQSGFVKEEDTRAFAGRIYKEAQRLISLVGDVIKISQLDEGEVPYQWEEVDLHDLAREVFASLHAAAEKKNVHLYMEGGSAVLSTVRPIMEEILFNICDNAVKYNRENGEVFLRLQDSENEVQVMVRDNGIGIPKEDQERIFERFYRVDKSHSKAIGGTGLGLSIVKHGVHFLGGKLSLLSEPGRGTEITLWFHKKRTEKEGKESE
ncbi:MAG: ATP-binding protein [Clostridiales bacterium]|nr:ATP-binding protein [Clostridiales bacterium]